MQKNPIGVGFCYKPDVAILRAQEARLESIETLRGGDKRVWDSRIDTEYAKRSRKGREGGKVERQRICVGGNTFDKK